MTKMLYFPRTFFSHSISLLFLYPQTSSTSSLSSLTVEDAASLSPEKIEAIGRELSPYSYHHRFMSTSIIYRCSAILFLNGLSMLILKATFSRSHFLKAVAFLCPLRHHQLSHCCWIILFNVQTCYCFTSL